MDKKVLRQHRDFSTKLPYANKKIREIWMNIINTIYNSREDMNDKLHELRGKTKSRFYKNIRNNYDNMIIKMDEDPFSKNAQGISQLYHEVLILMKFQQTKQQVRNMNNNYYDLYYTVI